VRSVEEAFFMEAEVDEGKISLRNLSVLPDLKKEIVE
jgi:hypothetical protein